MFKGSVKEATFVHLFILSLSQTGKRKREKRTSAQRQRSQNPEGVVSDSVTAVGRAVVFLALCLWEGSSRMKRDVNMQLIETWFVWQRPKG